MIIITTGELSYCGGGWLSRGFRLWWQNIVYICTYYLFEVYSFQGELCMFDNYDIPEVNSIVLNDSGQKNF